MRVTLSRHEYESKLAYSVEEAANMTGWSRQTITRMFENEPGVLIRHHPAEMNKRRYRSIRIPRHVYERVIRRMSVQDVSASR